MRQTVLLCLLGAATAVFGFACVGIAAARSGGVGAGRVRAAVAR